MAITWTNAGSSDHLKVSDVSFDPQTPVKGKDITVTLTGTLNTDVTSGEARSTLKYGIITVLKQNEPLDAAAAGPYAPQIVIPIPADSPSGSYMGSVGLTDQNDQEIACINLSLSLS